VELALAAWDVPALAAAWRAAQPFPHVVIDGMVSDAAFERLRDALAREPHDIERSEIVDCFASAAELVDPDLAAFAAAMCAPAVLDAVHAITGKRVSTVEVRSYCYVAGGYLLPHTDGMRSAGRQIAFAAYLSVDGQCEGGDLELFRCELDAAGDIAAAEPAALIEHRGNRLVLFDVSETSLHQIREVTAGSRVSLAGWYR
jgi:Rps23 Pro-64 3,4-dihydroxylase Tpa1-like proline 4-hydroxylase